ILKIQTKRFQTSSTTNLSVKKISNQKSTPAIVIKAKRSKNHRITLISAKMTLSFVLTVKFFLVYLLSSYLWNSYSLPGGGGAGSSSAILGLSDSDGGGGGGVNFLKWPSVSEIIPSFLSTNQLNPPNNDSTAEKSNKNYCTDDVDSVPMTVVEKQLPCHHNIDGNNDDERIVDGELVGIGQRSYQIALFRRDKFACGGSFVSRRFILTAAHCVNGYQPENLKIRYASRQYDSGPLMAIHSIHVHPDYNPSLVRNDLALLRLTYPLPKIPLLISSAELNEKSNLEANQSVIVSGWGRTGRSLPISKRLLMAKLRIVDNEECQQQWSTMFQVNSESMICAGDLDKSACNGDSGGPLTFDIDGGNKLIGIVSVGSSTCLSAKRPNIYTNVAYFHDWIQKTINDNY
ncbi:hypothetical protein DERP_014834, partial [Dermatophagoides pteronyssinus]